MNENATKFKELLIEDPYLKDDLRRAASRYEGDRDDDRAVFDAIIAPVAQAANMPFTYDEALEAMRESRELNDDELDAVAGGIGIWKRIATGALVTTLLVSAAPVAAIAATASETATPSVVTSYIGDDYQALGATYSESSIKNPMLKLVTNLGSGYGHYVTNVTKGWWASNLVSVYAGDANGAFAKLNLGQIKMKAGVISLYQVNGVDFSLVRGFYTHDNETTQAVFYYSDGLFYQDAYTYNEHLGSLSWAAAISCSYLNQSKTLDGNGNSYYNKHAAGRQFMADIGCDDDAIYVNDDNLVKPTAETIGVTIANKKLADASGEETGDILVPIVVRGQGYEAEWASNVNLGTAAETADSGMEAVGFATAANKVYAEVEQYLANYGLEDEFAEGHVKFWVVGYSRAGATANLTAKRLVDKIERECQGGAKSQVISYTCEAAQGGTDAAEVPGNDYTCIHNMINAVDIVPYVAPTLMGFKRYGVDHYVPGTAAGEVKKTVKKITRGGSGGPTTVTTYCDNEVVKTKTDAYSEQKTLMLQQYKCLTSKDSYNDAFRPYAMDLVSYRFPLTFEKMYTYTNGDEAGNRAEDFVSDFMRIIQEGYDGAGQVAASRDAYNQPYKLNGKTYASTQQTLIDVMSALWNMNQAQRDLFMEKAYTIADYIPTLASMPSSEDPQPLGFDVLYDLVGEWDDADESCKEGIIKHLWEALKETGALDCLRYTDRNNLERDFPTLINIVFTFLDADYNCEPGEQSVSQGWAKGSDETMMYLATFMKEADYILSCHEFSVNEAWVRSYDSWYRNETNEYTLAQPDSVAAPSAWGTIGGKQLALAEGDGAITTLSGDQTIKLDNEDIVGEAIYYDLYEVRSNGVAVQVARNQLYRGGIKLEMSSKTEHYIIKAYSISYGVTGEVATYNVKLCDATHSVAVWDMPESGPYDISYEIGGKRAEERWAAGLPRDFREQTWMLEEGQDVAYTTAVPSDRVFLGWKVQILDAYGNVIADDIADALLGEAKTSPTLAYTLPEAGGTNLPAGYQLRFIATYCVQTDSVTVAYLFAPQVGNDPTQQVRLYFGNGTRGYYETQWFDQDGNIIGGKIEADGVYIVRINVEANVAAGLIFAEEMKLDYYVENVTDASVTKNDDGSITIELTFESASGEDPALMVDAPDAAAPEAEPEATPEVASDEL